MTNDKEVIGFVGLGNMGGPMCKHLVKAGHSVYVYDIDPEALSNATQAGGVAVDSASACASVADLFLTSLPRPDHVEEVMAGPHGALQSLRAGCIWVDLTTNRVDLVQKLAGEAPVDVQVVDSPVTGAVDGARNASLTLFVGGDSEAVDRVVPVLDNLGLVIRTGELGSGNVVKLVTNQLWFIHAAALGEGLALGLANGVNVETLWHAIKESVGDSFVARHDAPSIFAGHYDPSFSLDLCLKDLDLIEGLSASLPSPLMLTSAANKLFEEAAQRYGREVGELHVAKRIEDDNDLSFRMDGDWTPPWEG